MSENKEMIESEEMTEAVETVAPVVDEVIEQTVVEAVESDETPVEETVEAPVADDTAEVADEAQEPVAASEREDDDVYTEPVFHEGFLGTCERGLYKAWKWVKKVLHIPDLTKKQKAALWDKITTGILIALFATPFCVLIYILLWFIFRNA